jgi:protein subunit release factor A
MLPALVKVKGGSVDLEWLMNKLKVSTDIGSELISDLVSSGLVKFNEMTGMVSNETSYAFKKFGSHDKASRDVFISSYKKSLEIAKDSIEELEQAQDEAKEAELLKQMAHGFCFISAHEENIEEARQRIGEFRRNLIRLLESSEDPQKKPDCLVNLCTGFNVMDIS